MTVTNIVPDSVQSFFGREQLLGKLAEMSKQFDSFGELKESLKQKQKEQQDKYNEN